MNDRTACDRCGEWFKPGTEYLEHRAKCQTTQAVSLYVRSPEQRKGYVAGYLQALRDVDRREKEIRATWGEFMERQERAARLIEEMEGR